METPLPRTHSGPFKSFLSKLKLLHVAIALTVGFVALGISIGRFEGKSAAFEKEVIRVESESKDRDKEAADSTEKRLNAEAADVIRHIDELMKEQRATNQRIDQAQDVLRTLAADVAVLCSRLQGAGCSRR